MRIKLAIVGLNFGSQIVRHVTTPPINGVVDLIGVADLDAEKARAVALSCGAEVLTLDEILSRQDIEAVGLFTGPFGRAALVRRIVRAGKHVLTTKPFETTSRDLDALFAEAEAAKRIIHVNSPAPRRSAELQRIHDVAKKFDLGRIVSARGEAWGSYFEKANGTWYDDPTLCPAAPIMRLGIYLIHDIIDLMGRPESIMVQEGRVRTQRPTADNALLTLSLPGGGIGSVFASFCVDDGQPYRNALTVNFERGTFYRNVGPLGIGSGARSTLTLCIASGSRGEVVVNEEFEELSGDYQWAEFADAIRGARKHDKSWRSTLSAGVAVIEKLHLAASTGSVVRIPGGAT